MHDLDSVARGAQGVYEYLRHYPGRHMIEPGTLEACAAVDLCDVGMVRDGGEMGFYVPAPKR